MKHFKLNKQPKINSGFTIPEGYFDSLPEKIIAQLSDNKPKVISIFSKKKNWYFTVAAALVIALTIPLMTRFESQPAAVEKAALENYLANRDPLSNDDYANLLDDADIQKINIKLNIDDKTIEDVLSSNPNLEEYLIN